MTKDNLLRIAIAESSTIIRKGLIAVLRQISGNKYSFIEISSQDLLCSTVRQIKPNVLIINPLFIHTKSDISDLKEIAPMKVIGLQTHLIEKNELTYFDALISIYDQSDDLIKIVENIKEHTELPVTSEPLSSREKEIIICVVKGMTNKEIADKLFISVHTVITHRRNIARKLEIHSTAALTIYAIINKLIDITELH